MKTVEWINETVDCLVRAREELAKDTPNYQKAAMFIADANTRLTAARLTICHESLPAGSSPPCLRPGPWQSVQAVDEAAAKGFSGEG